MKQKINIRLSLIALIAIITTTVGITSVYYNLFQRQVRNDLKQNAVLLVETELFQNAYSFGKESAENLAHLSSGNLILRRNLGRNQCRPHSCTGNDRQPAPECNSVQ